MQSDNKQSAEIESAESSGREETGASLKTPMEERTAFSGYALRIFISHSHKDKGQAAQLKKWLELFGFEAFVAHEDIQPSKEWEREILSFLQKSDVFIPILTTDFYESEWTEQETGIALSREVFPLPLKLGMNPQGFLKKYQALNCPSGISQEVAEKVLTVLGGNPALKSRVLNSLVRALETSSSFDQSNLIARQLSTFDELPGAYVVAICKAWLENNQVTHAFYATPLVETLLQKNRAYLPEELRNNLIMKFRETKEKTFI